MENDQQSQTLATFQADADSWQKQSSKNGRYSLIRNRNEMVLRELSARPKGARFLDIGCGTGQLVIEAARRGYLATGIDFSDAMINHCIRNKEQAGVNAEFELKSIFDIATEDREYEAISALGFIEYLPQTKLETLFELIGNLLTKGGLFVLGTRNRLYNVSSLNEFTEIEIRLGNLTNLIRQSIAFQIDTNFSERFEFLKSFSNVEPQPLNHPYTGTKVETRYQYSPGELYMRLRRNGFDLDNMYPVHYHAFPPKFKQDNLEHHEDIAGYVEEHAASDIRLIPFCSTLLLSAYRSS